MSEPERLKTQKARGISLMSHGSLHGFPFPFASTPKREKLIILPHEFPASHQFPLFARPCPEKPRHGFVESRMVHDAQGLLDVFAEARNADPLAEVVCMPKLTGKVSCVANNAAVYFAEGHAGATSGTSKALVIPCNSAGLTDVVKRYAHPYWRSMIERDITQGAFLELVEHEGDMVCVQIRNGPADTRAADYWVPSGGQYIAEVLTLPNPNFDLLQWEKMVKDLGPYGAIWLPGHTLASHYAVHGVANNKAVFCTAEPPEVGSHWLPPLNQVPKLNPMHYWQIEGYVGGYDQVGLAPKPYDWDVYGQAALEAMHESMAWEAPRFYSQHGENPSYHSQAQHICLAIAVLHAMPHWGAEPHLLRLRAFGAVAMAKYLSTACIGEARYFYTHGPGNWMSKKAATPWDELGFQYHKGLNRMDVYSRVLNLRLEKMVPFLQGAIRDFSGRWSNSDLNRRGCSDDCAYGGYKWREATKMALRLVEAVLAFKRAPKEETWNAVIEAYNAGVNVVHNNGKLLNKWIENKTIDSAAVAPQLGLINPWAMRIVFPQYAPEPVETKPDERAIARWKEMRADVPQKWREVRPGMVEVTGIPHVIPFKMLQRAYAWFRTNGGTQTLAELNGASLDIVVERILKSQAYKRLVKAAEGRKVRARPELVTVTVTEVPTMDITEWAGQNTSEAAE